MSKLDTVQTELLKEIGAYLMEVRQDQSKSLESIASTTFIPLRLLRAIEAGQAEVLPEPVFVRGFIRRYAEALGLDGLAIAKQFPLNPTPLPEPAAPKTLPPQPVQPPERIPTAPTVAVQGDRSSIPLLPIAIGVLALGGILFGLSQLFNRPPSPAVNSAPPVNNPTAVEASPSPQVAASPAVTPATTLNPTATSAAASPSPNPTGAVQAELTLNGNSWMQIVVDGRTNFEGTLRSGDRRSFSAREEIVIVAGNAGAVSLATNGGTSKTMGASGDVAEVTITSTSR